MFYLDCMDVFHFRAIDRLLTIGDQLIVVDNTNTFSNVSEKGDQPLSGINIGIRDVWDVSDDIQTRLCINYDLT